MLLWPSFFIDLTYTDVFSMHTVNIWFWACMLVTATEQLLDTNEHTRNYIFNHIFFFAFQHSISTLQSRINVNLINIVIIITENKVDCNICQGKTKAKYSCFQFDGKSGEMTSSTRRWRQKTFSSTKYRTPFGQQQESWPLAGSDFLNMRIHFILSASQICHTWLWAYAERFTDSRCWTRPKVAILVADQKERGL